MGVMFKQFDKVIRLFRNAARCTRGVTSVELAIAMPIMVALLLSGLEITRYVFIHQKIERTSASIADLVAREEVMTESKLADVFEITEQMLTPFHNESGTQVIVSSVTKSANESAKVAWQRSWGPTNTGSKIGSEGSDATLPPEMVIQDGDNVITAEVYYEFAPVFTPDLLGASTIYKRALYRPRYSSLASLIQN